MGDSGNTLTMTQCWCVSETGDKNGDMRAASGDETPQDVCRALNCQPTERRRILVSEGEVTEMNNLRIVAIGSLMAVVLCMVVILYYARVTSADKKIKLFLFFFHANSISKWNHFCFLRLIVQNALLIL